MSPTPVTPPAINEVVLVLGMMAVTVLIRYPMLVLVGKIKLPDSIFRALKYVPAAVLTAIIVPAIVIPDGSTVNLNPFSPYIIAAVVAGAISWRTKNLLLTIVIAMGVFLLARAIFH